MIYLPLPDTPCTNHGRARTKFGYSNALSRNGVRKAAHLWAYLDSGREIPEGYQIDHLCANTSCINPEHCKNGHPRTEENVYMWMNPQGRLWQRCRPCGVLAQQRYLQRKGEACGVL
jgi:hypothetical protein